MFFLSSSAIIYWIVAGIVWLASLAFGLDWGQGPPKGPRRWLAILFDGLGYGGDLLPEGSKGGIGRFVQRNIWVLFVLPLGLIVLFAFTG